MKFPLVAIPALAVSALAGCTTTDADGSMPAREAVGDCVATSAQGHIGRRASSEEGAELLRLTGARTLRWAPPNSAMTMDYRADRLTVSYDQNYAIDRIICG